MQKQTTPANVKTLVAGSAVARSVSATTVEEALVTVSLPPPGPNGGYEIVTVWTLTSSANNKIARVRLNGIAGTAFLAATVTTNATLADVRSIRNRNSNSSQVGSFSFSAGGNGLNGNSVVTSTTDWSTAKDLVISGQKASAGETLTLESFEIWRLPSL